ncbi:hypothetical protein [Kocuria marina]|nr:hypothetical protein [Kocuria indica]
MTKTIEAPPPGLLNIVAHLLGAETYAGADERLHRRIIGLVAGPRIT